MSRPRLLDLFCGAGGAAMGYHWAGFDVVGVDIEPQPDYPFEFYRADALDVAASLAEGTSFPFLGRFDAIHASPPCHDHSRIGMRQARNHGTGWMLPTTLERLAAQTVPWVVENVPGAPMPDPVTLCGTMFGLAAHREDTAAPIHLRRHRLFTASVPLVAPGPCRCTELRRLGSQVAGVYGHGGGRSNRGYTPRKAVAERLMGVTWTTRSRLAQMIPPAYTEWVGRQLLRHLAA